MRAIPWVLAASFACATVASAEEPAKAPEGADGPLAKVVALEASVAQHKKDKDAAGLAKDLDALVAMRLASASDPAVVDRLNALLGTALAGADDEVERAGIVAIGKMGDEANWKHLRKHLQQPDPKKAPPLLGDAIAAAGKIKAPGAVEPLLKIVEDSKVFPLAAEAMKALGEYGENKKVRARILEAIVGTVRKSLPGGKGARGGAGGGEDGGGGGEGEGSGGGGKGRDASRWGTLSPALVEAANKLTGRTAPTAEDWFELYDRHKSKPDALFAK